MKSEKNKINKLKSIHFQILNDFSYDPHYNKYSDLNLLKKIELNEFIHSSHSNLIHFKFKKLLICKFFILNEIFIFFL